MFTERLITIRGSAGLLCGAVCTCEEADECVLMAYPFAEERKLAQPHFVGVARRLAERGISSIRFDYHGCGNSEGGFHQGSISQWVDDLVSAAGFAHSRQPRAKLSALGLRLGANLVLSALKSGLAVRRALLWNPLPDPARYWREQLKRSRFASVMHQSCPCALSSDVAADLSGNAAGNRLADEIQRMSRLSAKVLPREVEVAWLCDPPAKDLPGRMVPGPAFWTTHVADRDTAFVGETCDWFLEKGAVRASV
jgi:alpha/beta superfamily hydrolase